ncbi:MAG: ABC transporter substrate-binding protein [Deltaproteobacteria bacterium]|nr:MAG: ABC transporter substrate-binding protein [Deltaproteobacteria bacterium]
MKSAIKIISAAVVLAVILIGYTKLHKPDRGLPLTELRIGYQPSIHQVAHMISMEKNWWQDGLKGSGIEKITEHQFPSGPPEMTAMLAGEIDIAYVGISPPMTAIYEGLEAKIVAGAQTQGSHLVLRPDINYESPRDLEGLKIATFPPGSVQDTVFRKWLKASSLSAGRDLVIAPMGPGDAISAIKAEVVDGIFLPHPGPAIIEIEGSGKMVLGSGEMWPKHPCCCLLVTENLISRYPNLVKEIVRIHIKASEYAIAHPEEAAKIYAKRMGWAIEKVEYSLKTWDGTWVHDPHPTIEPALEFTRVIYELNKPRYTEYLTEKDLFDTTFYDEVTRLDRGKD